MTKIDKPALDSCLLQVCAPKVKLLIKGKNKPKFDDDNESIKLNLEYNSANLLVKIIPSGGAKKVGGVEDKEKDKINDAISKERGAVIDGAVVKVMKTNKDSAVAHITLIEKVCKLITLFKAQP